MTDIPKTTDAAYDEAKRIGAIVRDLRAQSA
jgi:hypothetical protein